MLREPGRLRIGFTTASPIGTDVHPEAVSAVEHAARLLESLGHDVEEAAPRHRRRRTGAELPAHVLRPDPGRRRARQRAGRDARATWS